AQVRLARVRQLEGDARPALVTVERRELEPGGDVRVVGEPVERVAAWRLAEDERDDLLDGDRERVEDGVELGRARAWDHLVVPRGRGEALPVDREPDATEAARRHVGRERLARPLEVLDRRSARSARWGGASGGCDDRSGERADA